MQYPLTMSQAMEEASEAFAEITQAHAASKSKTSRTTSLKDFKWEFNVAERIDGCGSFMNMVQGAMRDAMSPPAKLSVEQRLKDVEGRLGVSLRAFKGSQVFYGKVFKVPQRVLNDYRKNYEGDDAEETRVAGLTPTQRDAELQEALKGLAGTPGFSMIRLGRL